MKASSYARALYELEIPQAEINEAKRILDENPILARTLSSPVIKMKEKSRVIDEIFPESVRSFIKVVCDNGSAGYFDEIFEACREYSDRKNKVLRARLRYVTPPDERQLEGIKALLLKKHDMRSIELEMTEDKTLIGGFIINAGDMEYDRSVKTRLNYVKKRLIRR